MRVLLIEDEPTTAKSIELMLGTEGFNVYTTDLGEEGLDLGKLYDYDIICLDLNLPDMHGYDVLKKLRTAKIGTPVLILSGIGEMDSKVRALGFGADDYVTKPFRMAQLHARIEAVLRRAAPVSQSRLAARQAVRADMAQGIQMPAQQARTLEIDRADAQARISTARPFRLGQHIHEARLSQGLALHQVERTCKIRWEFLQAIEHENWDYVPREELRRALRVYTNYLGIDLACLIGHPKKKRAQAPFPLPFAATLALVMVLLVVGIYLL